MSYYAHGDVRTSGVAALESRTALESPPPTITTMTAEDIADSVHSAPGERGGTEQLRDEPVLIAGPGSRATERTTRRIQCATIGQTLALDFQKPSDALPRVRIIWKEHDA